MAKLELVIEVIVEEVTEPQIFDPPKKMLTWSDYEGEPNYVCEKEVVAILPKLPNHANVVCLATGGGFWWATHCGTIKEVDK